VNLVTVNLLIVDDEPVICKGLRYTIPWEEINIKVVGEAYNGLEAMKMLEKHPIDIVLSDIRMPVVDGLELAEWINKEMPSVKMVIISGYEDFEYAKQAMRLGIKNYLLKPMNIDELLETIKNLADETILTRKKQLGYKQQQLRNYFVNQLYNTDANEFEPEWHVYFSTLTFHLFLSEIKEYVTYSLKESKKMDVTRTEWKDLIQQRLVEENMNSISIFFHENLLVTCCFKEDETILTCEQLFSVIEDISSNHNHLAFTLHSVPFSFNHFKVKYNELKTLTPFHFLNGESILTFPLESFVKDMEKPYPTEWEKEISDSLFSFKEEEMNAGIQQLFHFFQTYRFLANEVLEVCQNIVLMQLKRMKSLVDPKEIDLALQKKVDTQIYNSYDSIKHLVEEDFNKLFKVLKREMNVENQWLIEKAISYISSNYQKELKASDVANKINISPNYFSKLFKKTTGKNFNEYLNELRIENSKVLLIDTAERIFQIAEYVGYKDYKYFVKIFKNLTSLTPKEYRNLCCKTEKEDN
jgi:two-component system, response regulator YesN